MLRVLYMVIFPNHSLPSIPMEVMGSALLTHEDGEEVTLRNLLKATQVGGGNASI